MKAVTARQAQKKIEIEKLLVNQANKTGLTNISASAIYYFIYSKHKLSKILTRLPDLVTKQEKKYEYKLLSQDKFYQRSIVQHFIINQR